MAAKRLDGVRIAREIRAELTPGISAFAARHGRRPALSIVLAGEDPASQVYVRNKEKAGRETGLDVTVYRLPAEAPASSIDALVRRLNDDRACDGILVQSPLPAAIRKTHAQEIFDAIDPSKDVDGFHPCNVGRLVQGRTLLAPCTPSGIVELLRREQIPIAGARAAVIGRSEIVGKPMALLLLAADATVTVCHSRTRNLASVAAEADILATVIDVGINRLDSRAKAEEIFGSGSPRLEEFDRKGSLLAGDVHPDVERVAGALTPVPGGVGPLTIAMLLKNTLTAAERRAAAGA